MNIKHKALITGGAGFIGSHLVDRLKHEGYDITILDIKNENADITDFKCVSDYVEGQDIIFHLAAQADIRQSLNDHYSDLHQNVYGMINILEAMQQNKIKDLIFASSSALYGEANITPTPEEFMLTQTSLYGASKLSCEAFAQAYSQFMPLNFWAFRFSNVVGERCSRGVIWDFVHKLKQNPNKLEILGDGQQSKEYIHVSDVIDGMLLAYEKGKPDSYNIGHKTQTTVNQVADIVIDEMKLQNVKRIYTGGKHGWIGDNPKVILSIKRLERLGWKPKVSSEEAIRKTIRWTLSNL